MGKKFLAALVTGFFLVGMVGVAQADLFSFTGTGLEWNDGGTVFGSATMDVSVSGSTLKMVVDNTSPINVASVANAPGITGFGLDISNDLLVNMTGYELSAYDRNGLINLKIVLDKQKNPLWTVKYDKTSGIEADYSAWLQNVKGALYNPAATAGFAAEPNYFTTATLTIYFDVPPIVDYLGQWSPFVRMQNVGPEGKYSLKMPGTPVPEPAMMLLFGTGLVGLVGVARRRNKK